MYNISDTDTSTDTCTEQYLAASSCGKELTIAGIELIAFQSTRYCTESPQSPQGFQTHMKNVCYGVLSQSVTGIIRSRWKES